RIIFAQQSDDRRALTKRSNKRGGNLRHVPRNAEAGILQHLSQQGRRLLLLITRLGPFPDLHRSLPGRFLAALDRFVQTRLLCWRPRRPCQQQQERQDKASRAKSESVQSSRLHKRGKGRQLGYTLPFENFEPQDWR